MTIEDLLLMAFNEQDITNEEMETVNYRTKLEQDFLKDLSPEQIEKFDKIIDALLEKHVDEEYRLVQYIINFYRNLLSK